MTQSTQSFDYFSGKSIEIMLKAIDFSKTNNLISVIDQQCAVCRIQEWVNNLKIESNVNINLEDLQRKVEQFTLPDLDTLHIMTLQEITLYEAMLVNNLDNIPPNHNIAAHFLLHLKIIKNHLIYKFKIFE
jgi:hypothetical protein